MTMHLFLVAYTNDDGENLDMVAAAENAEQALILWQENWEAEDEDVRQARVWRLPPPPPEPQIVPWEDMAVIEPTERHNGD